MSATYGPKDVRAIVQQQVNKGARSIKIENSLFGDPQFGVVKTFKISYRISGGKIFEQVLKEHDTVRFPAN